MDSILKQKYTLPSSYSNFSNNSLMIFESPSLLSQREGKITSRKNHVFSVFDPDSVKVFI